MINYKNLAIELIKSVTANKPPFEGIQSCSHFLILIEQNKQMLPKSISDFLGISTARVAIVLGELEEKGLITREIDEADRRQIIVRLTDEGTAAATQKRREIIGKIADVLQQLGEDDAREYVRLMARVSQITKSKER